MGYSAAAGIALINSIANLRGFVGSYAIGALSKSTGSLYAGIGFLSLSFFMTAMLVLGLRKRT